MQLEKSFVGQNYQDKFVSKTYNFRDLFLNQ